MKTYLSEDRGDSFIVVTKGVSAELEASALSAVAAAKGPTTFDEIRALCQVEAKDLTAALAKLVKKGRILKTKAGFVMAAAQGGKVSPITDTTRLPAGALLGPLMKAGESIEAWGQRELLEAKGAALPVKGSEHPAFARVGFKFGDAFDSAFRAAQLPDGWRLVAGESLLLSKFLDAKGRTRGQVHYKAAQRGRFAEMALHPRFSVRVEYQGEFGKVGESHRAYVFDNATQTELFSTRTLRREGKDRKFLKTEELREEAAQWLAKHHPAHGDPAAYWD